MLKMKVSSRSQQENSNMQRAPKPLKGADWSGTVYLYISSCHPDTYEEGIEEHFDIFENASCIKVHETKMSHKYYTGFMVIVRGWEI